MLVAIISILLGSVSAGFGIMAFFFQKKAERNKQEMVEKHHALQLEMEAAEIELKYLMDLEAKAWLESGRVLEKEIQEAYWKAFPEKSPKQLERDWEEFVGNQGISVIPGNFSQEPLPVLDPGEFKEFSAKMLQEKRVANAMSRKKHEDVLQYRKLLESKGLKLE
jgi:hypothetical protein